jgi:hypothetical protein
MKRLMLLGASALILATFVPQEADAQQGRRGVRGPGSGVVMGRGVRGPGYTYRGGYRRGRGWGPAVGLGALGLGVLGAAGLLGRIGLGPGLRLLELTLLLERLVAGDGTGDLLRGPGDLVHQAGSFL